MAIDRAADRPWVLLPGTLCTGAVFDDCLDGVGVPRAARHVVDLSQPDVEDYLEAVARVATPDAIVCGFSLGAIVAAHLADRVDVARIVLFGLNPHADDPAKRDGRLSLAHDVACVGGAAALAPRLAGLAGSDPDAARAFILAMADDSQARIDAQTALALNRPGALDALKRSSVPIAFLTGTDDQQAPIAMAREAADITSGARLVALTGLGHYALVEDPDACARALISVLKEDL